MNIAKINEIQLIHELTKLGCENVDFIDNYKAIKITDELYIGCCLISKKFFLNIDYHHINAQIPLEIKTIKELKTLIKILKINSQ